MRFSNPRASAGSMVGSLSRIPGFWSQICRRGDLWVIYLLETTTDPSPALQRETRSLHLFR